MIATKQLYGASPINRVRRDRATITAIDAAILETVTADHPMTLRGLFYRLVSAGVIAKEEREYKNVGRYLLALRRRGDLPYGWIADSTRWQLRSTSPQAHTLTHTGDRATAPTPGRSSCV